MKYNFKRTFDAVNMHPDRQEQIRSMLASRIVQAHKEASMKKLHGNTNTHRRTRKVSTILIAAALAVSLLTGAAFAIYHFGLKDLEGPTVQIGEEEVHTLALNGLKGTPEYEAAQKWESHVNEWYEKGENLLTVDSVVDESDMYFNYGAISQEAKDTLDALLDEYGLKMHNTHTYVYSFDELDAALGISGFMPAAGDNGELPVSGSVYDDGTFSFNCAAALPDGTDVRYQFYHFVNGTFTRIGNLLADANDFEEWTYTTSSGDDVLLAISANKSIMAVNLDSSFVFVNILSGTENSDANRTSYGAQPVEKSDLEAFADSFDFAALNGLSR